MIIFTTKQGNPVIINERFVIKIYTNIKHGGTCVVTSDKEVIEIEEDMNDVVNYLFGPVSQEGCCGNCDDCSCEAKEEPKDN